MFWRPSNQIARLFLLEIYLRVKLERTWLPSSALPGRLCYLQFLQQTCYHLGIEIKQTTCHIVKDCKLLALNTNYLA